MAKKSVKNKKKISKARQKNVKYVEYLIFLTERAMVEIGDSGEKLFGIQLENLKKELLKN